MSHNVVCEKALNRVFIGVGVGDKGVGIDKSWMPIYFCHED